MIAVNCNAGMELKLINLKIIFPDCFPAPCKSPKGIGMMIIEY